MKAAAYQLALFFICLNMSLYIVAETQVLPIYMPPYENPSNMIARTLATLGLAGVGTLATIMTGNPWLGIAALTTWVGSVLFPFINWALFGFANFLGMIAATTGNSVSVLVVVNSVQAIMAFVWFWFLLGVVSQRFMEQ